MNKKSVRYHFLSKWYSKQRQSSEALVSEEGLREYKDRPSKEASDLSACCHRTLWTEHVLTPVSLA